MSATRRYESSRREAVEPVLQKSRFIGWLETQSGSLGTLARDAALTAAGKLYDAEPGWWVALGRLGTPKDALV